MRYLLLLEIMLLINIGCNRSEKNVERDFRLEDNPYRPDVIGESLYSKYCMECHGSKTANDNFLVGNIRNERYELSFLIDYINHQDSLLQHRNEQVIKIKEEWNNFNYIHDFKLTDEEVRAIVYYLKK